MATDLAQTSKVRALDMEDVRKQVARRQFGEDVLHGLYFQKSLKTIAENLADYFMSSDKVEEVYAADEDIEKTIVETIQKFNPKNLI